MILIYLLLGHFVSDFLLQPNNLVAWKNKSWKGVAMHSTIHFLVTSILLYLYVPTPTVLFASGVVAIAHFFIDSAKAAHQRKSSHSMSAYWLDQLCHYLSMVMSYVFIAPYILTQASPFVASGPVAPLLNTYVNPAVLIFLILAIFSTFTIEYSHYKDRHKTSKNTSALNHKAMIKRLFLVSLIYIGLLFVFPLYISAVGAAV